MNPRMIGGARTSSARKSSVRFSKLAYPVFVLGYLLFFTLKLPSWVFSGNMWDEAATNYFASAQDLPLLLGLTQTDAGYFSLPPRLIAALSELLLLPASAVPYFYTFSSAIATAMLVGVFILPQFRGSSLATYSEF